MNLKPFSIQPDPEMNSFLKNFSFEPTDKILEVGCNNEIGECLAAQLSKYTECWGIDLRLCADHKNVSKYIQGDFVTHYLPPNYFDIVIDVSSIHHFGFDYENKIIFDNDYDTKCVQKVYNILKPNGLYYLSEDQFQFEKYENCVDFFIRRYTLHEFTKRIIEPSKMKVEVEKFYDVNANEVPLNPSVNSVFYKLRKC